MTYTQTNRQTDRQRWSFVDGNTVKKKGHYCLHLVHYFQSYSLFRLTSHQVTYYLQVMNTELIKLLELAHLWRYRRRRSGRLLTEKQIKNHWNETTTYSQTLTHPPHTHTHITYHMITWFWRQNQRLFKIINIFFQSLFFFFFLNSINQCFNCVVWWMRLFLLFFLVQRAVKCWSLECWARTGAYGRAPGL